jgi:hypothetical protein
VAQAAGRYYDALRTGDPAALQATLAPDYFYNGLNAAQAANAFDVPLGVTYRSLSTRIETLTTVGETATATVSTVFSGSLNLEFAGLGRPPVNGSTRDLLELQQRGEEWRITAARPVRSTFEDARGTTIPPSLFDVTVNGQASIEVAPGTPIRLAGRSDFGAFLSTAIGMEAATARLSFELNEPWEVSLVAPGTPGRYLASAFSFTIAADLMTGEVLILAGDLVTLPVTVVAPP